MNLTFNNNNNDELFNSFSTCSEGSIYDCQNYIPLYQSVYNNEETHLNDSHHLNTSTQIKCLHENISYNIYNCELLDNDNNVKKDEIFFKFCPIIDPIKYMLGKYETDSTELPSITNNANTLEKINRIHNSAYIDSFFSYLSCNLNHNSSFMHGVEFYGAFLGKKTSFKFDVSDELDYLLDSKYFLDNLNSKFTLENVDISDILNDKKKPPLQIESSEVVLELSDTNEIETLDKLFTTSSKEENNSTLEEYTIKTKSLSNVSTSSKSTCSSRSSNTDNSESEEEKEEDNDTSIHDSDDESSYGSLESDEETNVIIDEMPVNIIALEKCNNTLDYLLVNDEITYEQLESLLFQIIMTLLTYQKLFHFTHNDLHTNNIMYVNTNRVYLYYCYNSKYYRVPTFGKIFKIIDFGRAIYKYNNITYCSDSFAKDGDASTQYNMEPFLNENKPRLEPNFSFDLSRLASAMFDFIVEDNFESMEALKAIPVYEAIIDWCTDDKGRNILYKKNGEERYPEFKLYKMITRTVHNHTPENQLERECFSKFKIPKKKSQKKPIMNIDELITS